MTALKTVKHPLKVEIASKPEEIKMGDGMLNKYEAYLHDPTRKHPTFLDLYRPERMDFLAEGMYEIEIELFVQKGKLQSRLIYIPVNNPNDRKAV